MPYRIILILTLMLVCSSGCNPKFLPGFRELEKKENERLERYAAEAIKNSAVFRELDHLCREQVPLFQGFVPITRHASDKERPVLTYFYSSQADYQEVQIFYKEYFSRNDWRMSDERDGGWGSDGLEFRKDSYKVILYHEGLGGDANFAFHCEKLLPGNQ